MSTEIAKQQVADCVVGAKIYGHFLVSAVETRENNDKKSRFLVVSLTDRTGTISGKLWQCTEQQEAMVRRGIFLSISGDVKEFKGAAEIHISQMTPVDNGYQIADFVPAAPHSPESMFQFLKRRTSTLPENMGKIVTYALDHHYEKLLTHPAAKSMHHNVLGGLLFHKATMLRVSAALKPIYPWLNFDLLDAGIMLHDIEKCTELDAEFGITSDYTVSGQLLGHITLGILLIEKAFLACGVEDDELKLVLQHMVLSHHDRPEWGSPVGPMMPEAMLLHMIDNVDAKMYALHAALLAKKPGAPLTEPLRILDGRKMFVYPPVSPEQN